MNLKQLLVFTNVYINTIKCILVYKYSIITPN